MNFIDPSRFPRPAIHPLEAQTSPLHTSDSGQQTDLIAREQLKNGGVALSLGKKQGISLKVKQQVQKPNLDSTNSIHSRTHGVFGWAKGTANSLISLPRYCWNQSWRGVHFLAGKGGEHMVFALQNLNQAQHENDRRLAHLARGPEFGQILAAVARMIANDLLVPYIRDNWTFGEFLGGSLANADLLPKAFQVILTRAIVSIAGYMKLDAEFSKRPITPVNVLSFLFKTISSELDCVSEEFARANAITNSKERDAEKQKIIAPIVEKFLNMAFPNAASDLPLFLGLRHIVMYGIKNKVLPDLLIQFNELRKFGASVQQAGGEFIAVESRQIAKNTTELIKTYLTVDSQAVADTLFNKSSVLKNMDVPSRASGTQYLAAQLREFGQAGDVNIWGLIDATIKTLSVRFFSALSKNKKTDEEASAAIATQLLSKLSLFVKKNGKAIAEVLKDFKNRNLTSDQILKEKAYIDKFLPLAKGCREMMGFAVEGKEIPDILRTFFDTIFTQQAAKNYEKILLPLLELYDAVDKPVSSSKKFHMQPIPDDLLNMCVILGQLTAKKLPEWLKGQSKNIADSIASNLPKEAEDVKTWLSAWINGQLVELVGSKNCTILNLWKFVAATVPQVLAHVLMSLTEGDKGRQDVVFAVLNRILGDLFQFSEENGEILKHTYEDLIKDNKNPAKQQEFVALFEPFCSKLLGEIGVGHGRQLPVPELLNKSTVNQLGEAGPRVCAQLYCDFSRLFLDAETTADRMHKDKATEGVARLSKVAADLVSDATPKLLYENSDSIAESIVDNLYTEEVQAETPSAAHKAKLKIWLAGQIKILGPSLRESYPKLWKLLGSGVETLLAHIFFNLSKDNTEHAEASIFGLTKILKTIHSFVKEHDDSVVKVFKDLTNSGVQDPSSHSDYVNLFVPLCEELERLMGLSDFPGLVKGTLSAIFKNTAPAQIARHYRMYLVPLSQLFDAIDHPQSVSRRSELEKLPGGSRLASWCEFAGKAVGEGVPKLASDPDQRKNIASQISMALAKAIAPPQQLKSLQDRLAGKSIRELPEQDAGVDKLYSLYSWLSKWLEIKIQAAGDCHNPQVKKIWNFIQMHLDAIVAHIILNLVGKDTSGQDALFVAVNQLLNCYVSFLKEHGKEVEIAFKALQENDKDPATNKNFISLFQPLYTSVMEKAGLREGLNLPLPDFIVKIAEKQLKQLVPELLAGLYTNFSHLKGQQERSMDRIRHVLNPKNLPQGSVYGDAADAIKNMCLYCSSQIVTTIKETRVDNKALVSAGAQVKIEEAIPSLKDPLIENIGEQLQGAMNSIFLELAANRLESAVAEGTALNSEFVNDILGTFLKSMLNYTDEQKERIEAAFKIEDPILKKKELRQLFAGRASEIFALLKAPSTGQNQAPLSLPLSSLLSNQVWTQVEHTILPDFLASVYMNKIAAAKKAEEDKEALQKLTGSSLRLEACDIIAEFVARFLPSFTKVDKDMISELIYEVAAQKLSESGNPEGLSLLEFLNRNQMVIHQELSHAIFHSSSLLTELQTFTKENLKPILVKAFTRLTQRINSFEEPNGDNLHKEYLVKLSIRLMTIIKDHLQTLNKIARQHHKEVFHKIDHNTLIREFNSLHRGASQSDKALESRKTVQTTKEKIRGLRREMEALKKWNYLIINYKNKIALVREQIKIQEKILRKAKQLINEERRKAFFDPFSNVMLELAGLSSANDLPFPSPMKELIWEQVHKTLMPAMLNNIFDSILEPYSRNKMVITALEMYNESLKKTAETSQNKSQLPKNPLPKAKKSETRDPLQKALDKACGELFQEVVQMVPQSLIKSAFKIDQIKSAVARNVGRSLREKLSQTFSLQKIVDISIASGIPSFHKGGIWKVEKEPGDWVELEKNQNIAGKVKFFPAKMGANGKMIEIPELDFAFLQSEEEVEDAAIKRIDDEEISLRQMRNLMISTTHQAISDVIKAPFVTFLDFWDKNVDKVFGKYSTSVRSVFRFIGLRLVYKLLEGIMTCLFYLPKHAFWFFMDRHIGTRVDEVIKGLQLDIHENLFYKMCDELARSLGGDLAKSSNNTKRKN